ncbi:hypothetical protein WJX79_003595 [Trebouxia sp. C0005]
MALADLPDDALRAVLQRLGPQELCRCKSVCRKLALMASEDRLWDLLCQSWFRRHGEHSGLCNATPRSLCAQLSKSSFATLYQMLHLLGGWPEGLWLNYLAEQVGTYCRILLDKQPVQVIIGASDDDHFSLPVTALRVNSRAGTLVVQFPHTESSTAPIIWHDSQALGRLPGLWTAWYGAHGPEIVHVWFEKSLLKHSSVTAHEEPDHLPRPRLVGCKVTGDPNVPANQWTFEAQAADMRSGRWDGHGTWQDQDEDELLYRPIVKFNGLPTLVDMREREVQARFCCQGRINHDPADYKPEWVPAQLITYEGREFAKFNAQVQALYVCLVRGFYMLGKHAV